jgi:peptidoglycan/xylan/chitin deacetylase (PgdA/CDA1 family)
VPDRELVNICFHGVGTPERELEPGEARYWVASEQFQSILEEIAGWPAVRISFDDGNASDLEIGLDALRQRNLRATFFVLAGRLGAPGSLDDDSVRELHEAGMTIGTHGMDHKPWRDMDAVTSRRELVEARQHLSDLIGVSIDDVALPLGRYDRRLLSDLRRLRYTAVYTSDRRPARLGSWLQPRFSVRDADNAQTLRACVADSRSPYRRARLETVGWVKRLR